MGGMQVLQWAASYPERVFAALPIACATRHSAQNIAFHEVGRQAVMADPEWRGGRYLRRGHQSAPRPRGRAHGRAHHLSVGRRAAPQVRPQVPGPREPDVLVRRRFRGRSPICATRASSFVERFDANSYLYLTRAMDYFDLAADYDGVLANAFKRHADALLRGLVHLATGCSRPRNRAPSCTRSMPRGARVSFAEIVTDKGHDAFLLDEPELFAIVRGFLDGAAKARGLTRRGGERCCSRLKRDLTMAEAARAPGGARVDLLLVADMVEPGARVLDVGCGDGELLRLLARRAASTAAASSCRARASTNASPRASR